MDLIVAFHNFATESNNEIANAKFFSRQTGNLAVGYKRDLIEDLGALQYVNGASPFTQQVRILFKLFP